MSSSRLPTITFAILGAGCVLALGSIIWALEPWDPGWWLDFIKSHLAQDLPLPTDAEERQRLAYRAGMELFGTPVSAKEIAAFVSDPEPTALDTLAKRLANRRGTSPFAGNLTSGATRFRVLPADPNAAKQPRTASNPGRYTLGENIRLVVTRRPFGRRVVNEASIRFSSPDPTKPAPAEPHRVRLPDGYATWVAAWERGSTVLWVSRRFAVISYDFTTPGQVKETHFEAAEINRAPEPLRDLLRPALRKGVRDAPPAATSAP